jgi:hypothetical protein
MGLLVLSIFVHSTRRSALLFFVCCVGLTEASAQSGLHTFLRLSWPEKRWTLSHPFVAGKALAAAREARFESRQLALSPLFDGDSLGGQVDAFRHAYWMARCAQEFAPNKALRLGSAHEQGNYRQFKKSRMEDGTPADSIFCEMDLFNNRVGVDLGTEFRFAPADSLQKIVQSAILNGQLRIIRKDESGVALDCSGRRIDPAEYRGVWGIPKCLITSDRPRQN